MRSRLLVVSVVLVLAACGDPRADGNPDSAPVPAVSTTAAPHQCGDCATSDQPTIIAVHDDFAFYGPCGNGTVDVFGVTHYQLFSEEVELLDESRYPVAESAQAPAALVRVAPPGPGDDIGTLIVYSDGMARYESDSGTIEWLTTDPHTYNWEC